MNTLYIIFLLVAGILILIRVLLPVIARTIANRALGKIIDLRGYIRKISLSLLGGSITIHDLTLAKTDQASGIETLVVAVKEIKIMIPFRKLLSKKFMGSIRITEPDILYASVFEKFETKKLEAMPQVNTSISPLKNALAKLPPLTLNVNIHKGKVRYINHTGGVAIDTAVSNIDISLFHFSNQNAVKNSVAKVSAEVYQGLLSLDMQLNPMADQLTFDMKMDLQNANMVLLNNFFRGFAKMDISHGTLSMNAEIVAKDGALKGYLTPVLKDIDIVGAEDEGDSLFKKIWERIVAWVFKLLENSKTDQLATRIPFEGRLDDPQIDFSAAITGILKNAFIQAIRPSFKNVFSSNKRIRTASRRRKDRTVSI